MLRTSLGTLLRNSLKIGLRLCAVTLVTLELMGQVLFPGKDACANLLGTGICLLPRPILSAKQVEILERLHSDHSTYVQFDPTLGWSIRPNRTVEHQGAVYTSNDIGIRASRSYSLDPPENTVRIAAFGASFTHGDEVSDEYTWPRLLEQMQPDLEVMNWGVGGYGTDQAFLRYKTRGAAYAPDLVLIGYEEENKYRNVNRFRPFYIARTEYPLTKPVFALEDEGLELLPNPFGSAAELRDSIYEDPRHFLDIICPSDYHCLRPGYQPSALDRLKSYRLLRTIVFGIRLSGHNQRRGMSLVRSYQGPPDPPEEATLRLLHDFANEVERHNAVPVLVLLPNMTDLAQHENEETPHYQEFAKRLGQEGIHVLDLTDAFLEAKHEGEVEFDAFFSPVVQHYNEAGNRVVSQAVLNYLTQSGIYSPKD